MEHLLTPHGDFALNGAIELRGVQPLGISVPHWKKKSCFGPHTKYIATRHHKMSHNVLSKFAILCWATFTAILDHGLNTPALEG